MPATSSPFERVIGAIDVPVAPGRARLDLAHRAENSNRNGTLHGGVIASLAAIAGARALRDPAATPLGAGSPIDLSLQFVAAAAGVDVVARARVSRRGREIGFAEIAIDAAAGGPVARALLAARTAPLPPCAPATGGEAARHAEALGRLERSRFSGSAFSARLAVSSASLPTGGVVALLPWRESLADEGGAVHAGAVATLVDAAGGASAWTRGGFDPRGRAATIAMHLSIGAGARGADLLAIARAPSGSGGIFAIGVDVLRRDDGAAVAAGSVVYRVSRPGDRPGEGG